jgi:hypothetical protein
MKATVIFPYYINMRNTVWEGRDILALMELVTYDVIATNSFMERNAVLMQRDSSGNIT